VVPTLRKVREGWATHIFRVRHPRMEVRGVPLIHDKTVDEWGTAVLGYFMTGPPARTSIPSAQDKPHQVAPRHHSGDCRGIRPRPTHAQYSRFPSRHAWGDGSVHSLIAWADGQATCRRQRSEKDCGVRFVVSHPSLEKSEGWATQLLWFGQGCATRPGTFGGGWRHD